MNAVKQDYKLVSKLLKMWFNANDPDHGEVYRQLAMKLMNVYRWELDDFAIVRNCQ